MVDRVLDLIKNSNGKITPGALARSLGVDKASLENLLLQMKLDGIILESNNKLSMFPDNMLIGNISVTKSGNKAIFYNGEIIYVSSNFFNYVILNDTVSFIINNKKEAEITSIIDRKIKDVACRVVACGKKKKIECFYNGININLPKEVIDNLNVGDVILVSIGINDIDCGFCNSQFKKVIGHANDPNIDEVMIAASYGFDNEYSNAYMKGLSSISSEISEKEIRKRKDLRHLPIITIDPINAKDMDDGIYACRLKSGNYKVYVTIADVSHFVKLFGEIFNRDLEKGNSCYINNSVFHMLHPILSNIICSLNPDEDKLTKTVIMEIDKSGNIVDYDICKSIIRSRKKMDYDNVDKVIEGNFIPDGYEEYVDIIKVLNEVAVLLERKTTIVNGKIAFPSQETEKDYDEMGNIISVRDAISTPSKKLVEHLMIAANVCVAKYILCCNSQSIFRVHDVPDVRKVNLTLTKINNTNDLGIVFKLIKSVKDPKTIQTILNKLSQLDEYPIISQLILKCMARAKYSDINTGHYALAEAVYTHFTSPIRRICDLIVHTILDVLLEEESSINEEDYFKLMNLLPDISRQASYMERRADAAENAGNKLAIIKSMQNCIGYDYDAEVIDIDESIRIKINGIECFAKFGDLSNSFSYDSSTGKYYDTSNNMILKIGAKIKVSLVSVNLNNQTIKVNILGVTKSKLLVKKIDNNIKVRRKRRCVV